MSKEAKSIKVRIPEFRSSRSEWRKSIHKAVWERVTKQGIKYSEHDHLQIRVLLYFDRTKIGRTDVDNRAKDVMDALQGLTGGFGKKKRVLPPIIPNDNQIYRLVVEKSLPPKQSHGLGHLTIGKLKDKR